jgi:hypothetical protein
MQPLPREAGVAAFPGRAMMGELLHRPTGRRLRIICLANAARMLKPLCYTHAAGAVVSATPNQAIERTAFKHRFACFFTAAHRER